MDCVGDCLLTTFRVFQYLFSIVALGCGAYITCELYSISDSAYLLEQSINALQNGTSDVVSLDQDIINGLDMLASLVIHVLRFLQGTPTRAIVISAVGLWSIIVVTYLFFAHRSKYHPATNKRSIRVLLELVTFFAWAAATVCSTLLALEYGAIAMTSGIEAKAAVKTCTSALEEVLQRSSSGKSMSAALNIVSDIVTMGALSIVSVVASGFCWTVSFVSLIVACCMGGKKRGSDSERGTSTSMIADPSRVGYVGKPVMYVSEASFSAPSPAILATRY